jgi:hypothetical protein
MSHETNGNRHKMTYWKVPSVLLVGVLGGMLGCATSADDPSDEPAELASVEDAVSTGPLVASLKLASGQVIDFYDYGSNALIVESGTAYATPALPNTRDAIARDQLVSLWTHLSPETPVPAALESLQHRLMSLPAASDAVPAMPSLKTGGAKLANLGPITSAPVGCNNGCCDFNWLSTFAECQGNYSFSWFLFNYGWSFASNGSAALYQGLVCSASGTSTYSVSVGGSGGTWSVPQATYRWFHWTTGFFRQSMTSSVNSSGNQHLHTYCGGVN